MLGDSNAGTVQELDETDLRANLGPQIPGSKDRRDEFRLGGAKSQILTDDR
jgi:hypothetical protein